MIIFAHILYSAVLLLFNSITYQYKKIKQHYTCKYKLNAISLQKIFYLWLLLL